MQVATPIVALLLLAPLASSQSTPSPSGTGSQNAGTPPSSAGTTWRLRYVDLALSDESATLGVRTTALEDRGFLGFHATVSEDDDVGLSGELLRMAELEGLPVRLGVGLGAHAVFVDRPDANVYGLSLAGLAEYDLGLRVPTTASLKVAYAPDVTTFDDGDALLDVLLRLRADLSDYATAFVGFHFLQVDVGPSIEVDDRLQVGIRLGF